MNKNLPSQHIDKIKTISTILLWCLVSWFIVVVILYLWFLIFDRVEGQEVGGQWKTPALLVAWLFGVLGGLCSLHRRLKKMSFDDLELLSSPKASTLLSPFVGGFMAVILYLAFIGNLLEGSLFPDFERIIRDENNNVLQGEALAIELKRIEKLKLSYGLNFQHEQLEFESIFDLRAKNGIEDYAKLLVWSFMAGFSEMLVVTMLGKINKPQATDPTC